MKQKTLKKWLKVLHVVKTILLLVSLAVLFYLGEMCITWYHESAHHAVFTEYGVNSTVEIDWLMGGGQTITEELCSSDCNKLQMYNEIFGYHMSAFIFNLWCMLWFYLVFVYAIMPIIDRAGGI